MPDSKQAAHPDIKIAPLDTKKPEPLWDLIEKMGFRKDRGYFERSIERQEAGELQVLMAATQGQIVGYCLMNWQPKYTYFKLNDMPEIQDLNVMRDFRNRGVGTAMILHCEDLARARKHTSMGIGVGLDSSFGPAQRLYVRLGYVPDGNGISYDRKPVLSGEFRPIDDNLCLMMSKTLTTGLK